jgi:uncharacterized protein YegP (UPF0339 family)
MGVKYEIVKDKAAKFRFQLKVANGEIIAGSQNYDTKAGAHNGIESVKTNAAAVKVLRTRACTHLAVRWEEPMKKAMGASLAAAVALTPLWISPAQAHAEDPCVSITNPAAHQACIDKPQTDDSTRGPRMGDCQASPDYGQVGQFCRNFWVRKSAPSNAPRGYVERIKIAPAPGESATL